MKISTLLADDVIPLVYIYYRAALPPYISADENTRSNGRVVNAIWPRFALLNIKPSSERKHDFEHFTCAYCNVLHDVTSAVAGSLLFLSL
jgi:hypothetical protein